MLYGDHRAGANNSYYSDYDSDDSEEYTDNIMNSKLSVTGAHGGRKLKRNMDSRENSKLNGVINRVSNFVGMTSNKINRLSKVSGAAARKLSSVSRSSKTNKKHAFRNDRPFDKIRREIYKRDKDVFSGQKKKNIESFDELKSYN